MKALEVKELTKEYPSFSLDKVSFSVEERRIVGLIGRNGAGKSTTLKSIVGLVPSEGIVKIFGRDAKTDELTVKSLVGYVGGRFGYYPLKRLAAVKSSVARFYPEWSEERYREYMHKFGLDERKRVRELSDGMKVKFSLALALSHGAKLLILDEPTSGLDPVSREEFCDIILRLVREEGASVLFSTHVTSDLMRIADDIVYISCGKVLAASSLDELLSKYTPAKFDSLESARTAGAVGVKEVKSGYEGLIKNADCQSAQSVSEATLDSIMIHLEAARERGESL